MASLDFVRRLLAAGNVPPRINSVDGLRACLQGLRDVSDTVERAALAGVTADCVGWAFAGGYQCAGARIDPTAAQRGDLAALCVTEEGGGHPRAMRTTLARSAEGWTLDGRKTFVTLGAEADTLLVVATTGLDAAGRNQLRIARVPSAQRGVTLRPLAPLPFAPEIGHASASFEAVALDEAALLDGDGYERVVKPFRTIEDVHVMAAILGWALAVARRSKWAPTWSEEAVALLTTLRAINAAPPLAAETHLVLAGTLTAVKRHLDAADWALSEPATREGWQRDRALLEVASMVREKRRETAWTSLGG